MINELYPEEVKQFIRVAKWNDGLVPEELGGGTRNNNVCNPPFDLALNTEEIKEFYKALVNGDLVEMVDAYADTKFVYYGILYKLGNLTTNYDAADIDSFKKTVEDTIYILKYIRMQLESMYQILYTFEVYTDVLNKAFDIVCEANEQKGTVKNEYGKTIKGAKWVNPAEAIKKLLDMNGLI